MKTLDEFVKEFLPESRLVKFVIKEAIADEFIAEACKLEERLLTKFLDVGK